MVGIWEDSLDWKKGEKLELKERNELVRLVGNGSWYRIGSDSRKHGQSMNRKQILEVEVKDGCGRGGSARTGSKNRNLLWETRPGSG